MRERTYSSPNRGIRVKLNLTLLVFVIFFFFL